MEGNLEEEKGARGDKEEEGSRRKKKWKGKEEWEVGEGVKKRGGVTLSRRRVQNQVPLDPECAQTTPSMYFWYRLTLKASDRIEDGGPPVLSLSLSLLVAWCLVAAFMINGLKSTGKVSHHFLIS